MTVKKIIYHCYGGAHSSVVAAAIHLGQLNAKKIPKDRELLELTLFDRQTRDGHGQLHFFGFDEQNREVYSVGCRNAGHTVAAVLTELSRILGREGELYFVDTLHCVNCKMRIGGYLSRRWQLVRLGRPLVLSGTREAYAEIVKLVERVKRELST